VPTPFAGHAGRYSAARACGMAGRSFLPVVVSRKWPVDIVRACSCSAWADADGLQQRQLLPPRLLVKDRTSSTRRAT
jgi:hypothetical protein